MEQLTLDAAEGKALKRDGQDAVEAADSLFVTFMRNRAMMISDEKGMVTSDDLRIVADQLGLMPSSQNAWGAIIRGPRWKIIGRKRSAIPSNHHREIKIWRYEPL